MTLSEILKELRTNKDDILILNAEEKKSLLVYITMLEKVIDMELKWT